MNKRLCIHEERPCLGREKIPVNGKVSCCCDEIAEEKLIILNALDAIEDCTPTCDSLLRIGSRLSYATEAINPHNDLYLKEMLTLVKHFTILLYAHKERILCEAELREITCSFIKVLKESLSDYFLNERSGLTAYNTLSSMKADFATLELALGVCMLIREDEEALDDIFF